MLRAGARTYVVKSDSTDEILWAIHRTVAGDDTVAEDLAFQVASVIAQHQDAERPMSRRRRLQRARIERVLTEREYSMVFQPVVDLDDSSIVGVEALARFTTPPRRGPDVWLAEADAVGLLQPLELALCRAALNEMSTLPVDGFVAMNLSPITAMSEDMAGLLQGVDADRLVLEMTEHAPIDDYDGLRAALEAPRERGIRLAVDDAGAGFASLRHIVRLEPDFIKLDITLTSGIEDDPVRQALAVALVSFAGQIGATVIAEGVETAQQLDALRVAGIRYAQGFYLGKPAPAATLAP
jgi:EAL domain-containing protein (putative c-di-GMP-specific phosphodiesterase class I)